MSYQIVEKRPHDGSVFLVKYTFDNLTWNQFYACSLHEQGASLSFFGCRVKKSIGIDNALKLVSVKIQDLVLDGNLARVLVLVVKKPEWFDNFEQLETLVKENDGLNPLSPFNLPGLTEYH